jgi:hypothetical protein
MFDLIGMSASVSESEMITKRKGRSAASIDPGWYAFVDHVVANKRVWKTLEVSHDVVRSSNNVRRILATIAKEKKLKMSGHDVKGDCLQVASRYVKMNPSTGKDEYFPATKENPETHVFVRYYTK